MWILQLAQKKLVAFLLLTKLKIPFVRIFYLRIRANRYKIYNRCASDAASWEFLSGSEWQTDSSLAFECIQVLLVLFRRVSEVVFAKGWPYSVNVVPVLVFNSCPGCRLLSHCDNRWLFWLLLLWLLLWLWWLLFSMIFQVADCCPTVTIASTGLASSSFPQLMGEYRFNCK